MKSSLSTGPRAALAYVSTLIVLLCSCRPGVCADSGTNRQAAPRVERVGSTNAPAGFQIENGFRLEVVAAEPLVTAPVAMAFDEDGRLFVAEMPEAADGGNAQSSAGRIRMLQDTNADGVFETSGVYADNLSLPSAVACYGGGVFVGAGRELLYLKKATNGAEVRTVIAAGFGGTNLASASVRLNNLNWALDNRIHGVAGIADIGVPGLGATNTAPMAVNGSDFSLNPRTLAVTTETGPPQTGLSFDNWGRKFVSELARPLRTAMYERRYAERNPFSVSPRDMLDVASPATAIYRSVPVASPKTSGTQPRVASSPARTGSPATNALALTWLTNACGTVIYRGSAFPQTYMGNVFIADPHARVIHRMVLSENGLVPIGSRPPEEQSTEFLVSTEGTFRPMQIVNGPDGTLYVADRQSGGDRGRIYRIAPFKFKPPTQPRLGTARTYDLVAALSHPDGWQRDTAARLLYERRDPTTPALLDPVLSLSQVPLARAHALRALEGASALNQTRLLKALRDTDARVREQAIRLVEKTVTNGVIAEPVGGQLLNLATDPFLRVRYQLAFTLGEVVRQDRMLALAEIVRTDLANPWVVAAALSSVGGGAGDLFVALARDARLRADPGGQELLRRLTTMIAVRNRPEDVAQVMDFLQRSPLEPQAGFILLSAVGEGLQWAGSSWFQTTPLANLENYYVAAIRLAANDSLNNALRVDALRLLGVSSYTRSSSGLLLQIVEVPAPEPVRSAAIDALGRLNDPQIALGLLPRWRALTPSLRRDAVAALLTQSSRIPAVLGAVQDGRISRADVASPQMDFLRTHRDASISQAALRLFGPVPLHRPQALKQFTPALRLRGDPNRGGDIFRSRCSACHWPGNNAQPLGPVLTRARMEGKARTLAAIIEPNAEVRRDYAAYVVETVGGENLIGLLRDEKATTVTLGRLDGAAIVLPRTNIRYRQAQPWSLMPEGLEDGLTPQSMADLLAYVAPAPR